MKVKGGKGAELTIKAHHSAKIILGGGEQMLEFPFMTEIVPAFTVELKNVTEPVVIVDAGANFTSQPVEYRGAFECSDEKLNQIWNVSRWAVQICLQTHHLDSPNHQEPISDPGDYVIESMVNHYAFAQPWLARQDIRKFAWLLKDENYHNFHTSYSIGWLQMLMDYYDYTGDQSLVEEMAPYVHELLDTYASWRGTNGIISEAPNYMFMDWVTIGGFPVPSSAGGDRAGLSHGVLLSRPGNGVARGGADAATRRASKNTSSCAAKSPRRSTANCGSRTKGSIATANRFKPRSSPADGCRRTRTSRPSARTSTCWRCFTISRRRNSSRPSWKKCCAEKPLNTQPWFMHWVFQAIDHAGLFDRYGTRADAPLADRAGDAVVPRNVERRRPEPRLVLHAAGADVGAHSGRDAGRARFQDRFPSGRSFAT